MCGDGLELFWEEVEGEEFVRELAVACFAAEEVDGFVGEAGCVVGQTFRIW